MYAVKQQSSNFIITIAAPVPIKVELSLFICFSLCKNPLWPVMMDKRRLLIFYYNSMMEIQLRGYFSYVAADIVTIIYIIFQLDDQLHIFE